MTTTRDDPIVTIPPGPTAPHPPAMPRKFAPDYAKWLQVARNLEKATGGSTKGELIRPQLAAVHDVDTASFATDGVRCHILRNSGTHPAPVEPVAAMWKTMDRITEKNVSTAVSITAYHLMRLVDAALPIANGETHRVLLSVNGRLDITAHNADAGDFAGGFGNGDEFSGATCEYTKVGPDVKMPMNAKQLKQALAAFDPRQAVVLLFDSETTPIRLRPADDPLPGECWPEAIIMPLKNKDTGQ